MVAVRIPRSIAAAVPQTVGLLMIDEPGDTAGNTGIVVVEAELAERIECRDEVGPPERVREGQPVGGGGTVWVGVASIGWPGARRVVSARGDPGPIRELFVERGGPNRGRDLRPYAARRLRRKIEA
jgi:hypothetical protein